MQEIQWIILYYLTPHAFWDITDFGAKCEECVTINTITLEKGKFKRQIEIILLSTNHVHVINKFKHVTINNTSDKDIYSTIPFFPSYSSSPSICSKSNTVTNTNPTSTAFI